METPSIKKEFEQCHLEMDLRKLQSGDYVSSSTDECYRSFLAGRVSGISYCSDRDKARIAGLTKDAEPIYTDRIMCGVSRNEWHDKAWELYQTKAFDDCMLPKNVSIHTLRTIFNALYDSFSKDELTHQPAPKAIAAEDVTDEMARSLYDDLSLPDWPNAKSIFAAAVNAYINGVKP